MNSTIHLPLAVSAIERDYLTRERENLFQELWADPHTRVLPVFAGKVLLEQDRVALKLVKPNDIQNIELQVYLGYSTEGNGYEPSGTPLVMCVIDAVEAGRLESDESKWQLLRRTGAGLSDRDAGMYVQAISLANWHDSHKFCNQCGGATVSARGGWVRSCTSCGKELYPRTDPAVIVSVLDEHDRILLGSQGVWEDNRWSILAGYVEPGESLNAAVEREMFEEAGVRVEDIEYLGSQGWPFPHSIMMGFTARVRGTQQHKPDGVEIEKLRWFSREEIAAEMNSILLPGKLTIARAMIEHWYGHTLDAESGK